LIHPAVDHPANAGLRRYLEPRLRPGMAAVLSPSEVSRPYETLGTHPDLVARLWDEITRELPVDCRLVFFGTPALVHPVSGIVFGFAGGTHSYALRLPPREHAVALLAGAKRIHDYSARVPSFDLSVVGDEWLFCRWFAEEPAWCRAAYELAT
jgi:hypothetical protein